MSTLRIRALSALAATLVALASCSSTPEARYTPGDIDNSASDASGTTTRQADAVSPAQTAEDCKNAPASVRSRSDACNPPPEGAANPPPAQQPPPR
jgi:hypothetical protein